LCGSAVRVCLPDRVSGARVSHITSPAPTDRDRVSNGLAAPPRPSPQPLAAPRRAPMPQLEQWARVRARTQCPLRRGAWYRVLQLSTAEAVLEVHGQPLSVPRPFLQVLPVRPRMWSVVPRLRGGASPPADWGSRYGVCPRCSARAALPEQAVSMRCPACKQAFVIAWSDSHWRVFELLSDTPAARAILRARDAALRLRIGHSG